MGKESGAITLYNRLSNRMAMMATVLDMGYWFVGLLPAVIKSTILIILFVLRCTQDNYPEVKSNIVKCLQRMRDLGVPLLLVMVKARIIAIIHIEAKEIFEKVAPDGSCFIASDSWVRKFVHTTLGWTYQKAT